MILEIRRIPLPDRLSHPTIREKQGNTVKSRCTLAECYNKKFNVLPANRKNRILAQRQRIFNIPPLGIAGFSGFPGRIFCLILWSLGLLIPPRGFRSPGLASNFYKYFPIHTLWGSPEGFDFFFTRKQDARVMK